jgi:hypothetical protein
MKGDLEAGLGALCSPVSEAVRINGRARTGYTGPSTYLETTLDIGASSRTMKYVNLCPQSKPSHLTSMV